MWLLASTLSWSLLCAGLLLLILVLLRRSHRYYGRKGGTTQSRARRRSFESSEKQPLMDAPNDILRWQVEMHETARDLKAELDSKLLVLQTLMRQADERIARLESMQHDKTSPPPDSNAGPPSRDTA